MEVTMNRLANTKNIWQGDSKKVLCVCSAGLLRSPTTAWVLSNAPYNYNTRAVGLYEDYALTPIDKAFVYWADEIVCMDEHQMNTIIDTYTEFMDYNKLKLDICCINIPDSFTFRDAKLIKIIEENYAKYRH